MEEFRSIQEKFVNILLASGFSEQEALRVSSTFFFSWFKSQTEEHKTPQAYETSVKEFLVRLKQNH
ncbi:hypothetical protein CVU76_03625 [Candidatus Dojkabacteria bacterium HGW-Dojkabacteria-1]|uniref:Uncharacterized protein n=1 Tax=Candidatus Dojkabacteria bacterium HGW-Dojkabacteria-1 TaxID=2013761 RepID=A0A2N2F4E6_9BACT|nr:MAG: hypothetical protein CVU76_03625 [Candidatus Dojkabacteria bacterium HGW-Dojkabacteria-1]